MKRLSHYAGSALMALTAGTANALVIDFEDVGSGDCAGAIPPVQSRGFRFRGNPEDPNMYICNAGVIQNNTSAALINANSRSIISMRPRQWGIFTLHSFFAGGRTEDFNPDQPVTLYDLATGIDILGHLLGGGTVSTSIALDTTVPYDWEQFFLPGTFTNLTSVVFTAQGNGPRPEFLIDDIVVTPQAIPEPASLMLMSLGLFALMAKRRRG